MTNSIPSKAVAVSLVLAAAMSFTAASAQDERSPAQQAMAEHTPDTATPTVQMQVRDVASTDILHITAGHSVELRGAAPLKRIYIGNPAVLQSFTAGPSEVVLTAKATGVSSLVIWDTLGQSRLYTVSIDVDPDSLKDAEREAFPTSRIDVHGHEGRIFLSGSVPSQEVMDSAFKMAGAYGKDVINSLRIVPVHGKQVQMKLRIVEVDRTKMEQYGINLTGTSQSTPFNLTTGQFPSTITSNGTSSTTGSSTGTAAATATDMLNLFLYSSKLNLGTTIKDLEQKQILQVLAEPTLTALSGETAKFLSGGEFPFPIAQASSGSAPIISISFRPYGVNVAFTPTVNEDGTIRLKIAPEVSTLDYSNAVSVSGFTIPALSTRRAETDVEIQNGQTFAVSGLLDRRTTESLNQIPGISKIPILGKLFVTKSYTNSVVELVVLVTATVVDPLTDKAHPVEPAFPIPFMDPNKFDQDLSKEQRLPPKKP